MGFTDRMEKKIEEMDEKRQQDMGNLFNYLSDLDIVGLDGILSEIKEIRDSGFYKKLIEASNNNKYEENVDFLGDLPKHRIEILAYDNLKKGGLLTTIFTKSIITVQDTLTLYSFIETTYYLHKNPLEKEDLLNIYFSGLDERIIFALENFDQVKLEDLPEPTPEYIKSLGKTYWAEKELYKKLNELMFEVMDFSLNYPGVKYSYSKYRSTEDLFIQFLAACNAVNNGRLGIGVNDTIVAYKTFLKLIKTDVTKYKAIPKRIIGLEDHGAYLVCKKCGTYYQIPEGESADDYSNECECGGKLKYLGSPHN
ncbi:hypothetical protein [Methanobacterium petrolearium]|uniref:hypothetical protein n=1 Tax=Methanobacterium petrolearium TaxID=710190 RepID=UPI001AE3DF4D|nr:hypothetical protein [Methanobacterium petrolearium]MBP1944728.1 hypothetical protein [Methanobacterium petrolearium]BDZ69994.1 hypothetical protein GCM10025861_05110 [Methanobacterium petrolearium]